MDSESTFDWDKFDLIFLFWYSIYPLNSFHFLYMKIFIKWITHWQTHGYRTRMITFLNELYHITLSKLSYQYRKYWCFYIANCILINQNYVVCVFLLSSFMGLVKSFHLDGIPNQKTKRQSLGEITDKHIITEAAG